MGTSGPALEIAVGEGFGGAVRIPGTACGLLLCLEVVRSGLKGGIFLLYRVEGGR